MRYLRLASVLGVMTLVACDSASIALAPDLSIVAPSRGTIFSTIEDPPAVPAFVIDVAVTGTFTPGGALRVSFDARANVWSEAAEVRVVLPEVEAMERQGWKLPLRLPVRTRLPARQTWQLQLSPGQRAQHELSVTIPLPGYYRVVVSALRRSPEAPFTMDGSEIQPAVHAQAWLYINEKGGRVVPSDSVPWWGPAARSSRSSDVRLTSSVAMLTEPSCSETTAVCGWAGWYNADSSRYEPFSGVHVHGIIREAQSGNGVGDFDDWTDVDGYVYMSYCDQLDYYVTGTATLSSSEVTISPSMSNEFSYTGCGVLIPLGPLADEEAKSLTDIEDLAPRSRSFYGYSRPKLRVRVSWDPNLPYAGVYYRGGDSVVVRYDQVWGEFGRKMIAHEYGHALHWVALGGYPTFNPCDPAVGYGSEHNLQCALREGFAEYHAVNTALAVPSYVDRLERNTTLDVGEDGSIVPYAVGAVLHDLTDAVAETQDAAAYPGSYVSDVLRTCEVDQSGWIAEDGVDHVVYCLERQVDPTITGSATYFVTRASDPVAQREGAVEPPTWSSADIRQVWKWNLYLEN